MKRVIKICLLMIISICIIGSNVYAADADIFTISDASGHVGDEVTLTINLDKELEFAAADLTIEYDASKLEYVKYTGLDILNKSAMNIVKNNTETGKVAIGYVSNPDANSLNKEPGQMLSVTFKIKNGASGTIDVNLICTTLKKDNSDSIPVSDAQAKITVLASENNGNTNNPTNNENNNNQNNNTNNNNNNNNNNNKNTDTKIIQPTNNNPTTANTAIPQTGESLSIVLITMIVLCSIVIVYFYKKYTYLKNI